MKKRRSGEDVADDLSDRFNRVTMSDAIHVGDDATLLRGLRKRRIRLEVHLNGRIISKSVLDRLHLSRVGQIIIIDS